MDECHQLGVAVLLERILELLRIARLAPLVFDHDGGAANALHVLDHAATEHAIAHHDDFLARFDHVDKARFHADGAGAGKREGQLIVGLVGIAQQLLELIHHLDKNRVEVADRGQR